MLATTIALAATLPAVPAPAGPAQDSLPYEDLAQRFLGEHAEASAPLQAALDARYARLRAGAFEVRFPDAALDDDRTRDELATALAALLRGQRAWLEWLDPEGSTPTSETSRDLEALEKWVDRWRPREVRRRPEGERDLLAALDAPDDVRAAAERAARGMERGGPFAPDREAAAGDSPPPPLDARLVLVPSREEFVTLVCAIGAVHPRHRGIYWTPDIAGWIEARHDDLRAICLRFPSDSDEPWDAPGTPMTARNPDGLGEQVLQLALASLALEWFEGRMDPDFSQSLANVLVIEVFGEVDTRSDGDLRPRSAPPRSVFVPGGLSHGGGLPPNSADSPWRAGNGSDYFRSVLRTAQKAGARAAGERRAERYFLLTSDDTSERHPAPAPFLGPEATRPPESVRGDYLEFGRAYRAAFVHWLREHGAGSPKESPARFAELLRRLHLAAPGADFAAELAGVYGKPLTASPPSKDDLEGAFLHWIAARR